MKKRTYSTIPESPAPTPEEQDTQMDKFRKDLQASCMESLQRSRRDTSWIAKCLTAENCLGIFLFILVWFAGGLFRVLQTSEGTLREHILNCEFFAFTLILGVFLLFFYVALNAPWKISRNIPRSKEFLLVSLMLILEFATVFAIVRTNAIPTDRPWQIITVMPLALFPAILINLLDSRTAVCTAILEAILLPMQVNVAGEEHFHLFCFAIIPSLTSVIFFRNIHARLHYLSQGILYGFLASLMGTCFYFISEHALPGEWPSFFMHILIPGLAQGVCVGIACMGLLAVLERLFRLPTPMTLSELTDVNTPLLQRLRNEAPGTYQHSLDVAEMATNAAAVIGADAKLVHVMGLYHDVGKLFAPQYFAENMSAGQNPLENSLTPAESAELIFEHTTHGAKLAKKYRLSSLILPAIRQHHGNTLLEHFYRKACDIATAQGTTPPEESAFRYPQTPTSSREVAILSLADSCEAAVRALLSAKPDMNSLAKKIVEGTKDAGPTSAMKCADILTENLLPKDLSAVTKAIDERIASVIRKRYEDHQLDNVDLTTKELCRLARSFRETILFHFHTRPEYRLK